jgi:antirestriction protein ArdC
MPDAWDPILDAECVVEDMPLRPAIMHGGDRACYRPGLDRVDMPSREAFARAEDYYGTLFHELAHATGHASRLDRAGMDGVPHAFGDPVYSREELVAEFASAFACRSVGVQSDLEQSAAYIKGWRDRIQADPKCVVWAAGRASRAADWILNERGE